MQVLWMMSAVRLTQHWYVDEAADHQHTPAFHLYIVHNTASLDYTPVYTCILPVQCSQCSFIRLHARVYWHFTCTLFTLDCTPMYTSISCVHCSQYSFNRLHTCVHWHFTCTLFTLDCTPVYTSILPVQCSQYSFIRLHTCVYWQKQNWKMKVTSNLQLQNSWYLHQQPVCYVTTPTWPSPLTSKLHHNLQLSQATFLTTYICCHNFLFWVKCPSRTDEHTACDTQLALLWDWSTQ